MCTTIILTVQFCLSQYSQKEDKYEEEIKILTDKLKEVRLLASKKHIDHNVYWYFIFKLKLKTFFQNQNFC